MVGGGGRGAGGGWGSLTPLLTSLISVIISHASLSPPNTLNPRVSSHFKTGARHRTWAPCKAAERAFALHLPQAGEDRSRPHPGRKASIRTEI